MIKLYKSLIENPAHYAVAKQRMIARMAEAEKKGKRQTKEERKKNAPISNSIEIPKDIVQKLKSLPESQDDIARSANNGTCVCRSITNISS